MPKRNSTIRAAATAAVLAVGASMAVSDSRPGSSSPIRDDIMLLYVGAEDCAPCRAWQRGEGAKFRASAEFAAITYREVKSPTLRDVLKDEHWPEDLRNYRLRLARGAGVPLWLLIADNEIIEQGFGASQWRDTVQPRLRSLTPR